MENDLFILGDTNINILDNGQNNLDIYKDMSNRKSNFGATPKKCTNLFYFRFKTTYKTSYENNMSHLNSS